jgi:hypothetical protein
VINTSHLNLMHLRKENIKRLEREKRDIKK